MTACTWPIPCNKDAEPSTTLCRAHNKSMGIKPEKPKMSYVIPKVSERKKIADKLSKPQKAALDKFYEHAILHAPFHCENCGCDLRESTLINPRTIVAHLLPKKSTIGGFPSVAAHEMNKAYLCFSCHHKYDNDSKDFIPTMPLLQTIKQRVQILLPLLTPEERRRVPDYLL